MQSHWEVLGVNGFNIDFARAQPIHNRTLNIYLNIKETNMRFMVVGWKEEDVYEKYFGSAQFWCF